MAIPSALSKAVSYDSATDKFHVYLSCGAVVSSAHGSIMVTIFPMLRKSVRACTKSLTTRPDTSIPKTSRLQRLSFSSGQVRFCICYLLQARAQQIIGTQCLRRDSPAVCYVQHGRRHGGQVKAVHLRALTRWPLAIRLSGVR